MTLKYIDTSRYIPGVPAKDLNDDEVASLEITEEQLIKSGLYRKARKTEKEGDN